MFCWMKFRQLFQTDMYLSSIIYKGYSQVSDPLSKRDYKDEEKKVIKNENYYCKLILFYIILEIIYRQLLLCK